MGKGKVVYVAICELLLVLVAAMFVPAFLMSKMYLAVATILTVSIGLATVAVGFLRRRKWAWYASWAACAIAIAFGGWLFWAAAHASPYGDGGEVGIIAMPMIVMALAACGIMLRYSLREFTLIDGR